MSTNSTTTNRLKPPRREIAVDPIPVELRALRRWVGWKWERNRNKWDKPPVSVVTGLKASKTDPASWTTFDDAMQAFNAGRIDGIGFCIAKKNDDHPADDPFVIIDVDNSLDADTGLPNDWATYLLEMFPDCYAEVSPSGHGIKIFVRAKLGPGKQSDDSKGIELLGPGSYVCVTGRICPGSPSAIDDGQDRIRHLQEDVVQDKSRTFATGMMSDRELALSALDGLADWRRDNYKPWIRVGQILHSIDSSLCSEWDSWSRGSDKYQASACQDKWKTFSATGNGLRIGTLIYWAKEDGWVPPRRQQHANGPRNPYTNGQAMSEPPQSPEPFVRKSVADLALHPPAMKPALLDPGLRRGEIANVISVSKIGKSWLAYSLAYSLAVERLWLERFATKRSRVLLLDNELHEETLECRLVKVADEMGINLADCRSHFEYLILRGKSRRNLFELRPELEKLTGAFDVVILDALYRMLPEDASENDNAQMTRLYNELDRLAAMLGAAFVCIHHSSKGSQSDKRVTDVGAGAGAQSRAADSHLILREHEEEGVVVMEAAVRSFAPIEPVGLRWEWPLWRPCDDIDVGRLRGRGTPGEEQQRERDAEADEAVLKQANGWHSARELRKSTGMGEGRVDRSIRRLVDGGFLEEDTQEKRGNKCKVYRKSLRAG